jgi:hypothetical protein
MSRNFEVLRKIEQQNGVLTAEHALEATARHEISTDRDSVLSSSVRVSSEILKLVHVLFLSSENAPHHVLFCGVNKRNGSGRICEATARVLANEISTPVCLVEADEARSMNVEMTPAPLPNTTASRGSIAQKIDRNLWAVTNRDLRSVAGSPCGIEQVCASLLSLRKEFGYVLVDAPPLGANTTASVLGQVMDGIVLALEANSTRRVTARNAKQTLDAARVRILGTVLNNRTFPIPEKLYRRL